MSSNPKAGNLHLLKRRFTAWWEGEPFDLDLVREELATHEANHQAEMPLAAELTLDPRLSALELLWGKGRIAPGDEDEDQEFVQAIASLLPDGRLLAIGPGLDAPLLPILHLERPVLIREWRHGIIDALRSRLPAYGDMISQLDLETIKLEEGIAGLFTWECFLYAPDKVRLLARAARALQPGGHWVAMDYCGAPSPFLAAAFASSFAEPHLCPEPELRTLIEAAGLEIVEAKDVSDRKLAQLRSAFARIGDQLESLSGALGGPDAVARAHEYSWEIQAWRARSELLATGRISVFQFVLRKPIGA